MRYFIIGFVSFTSLVAHALVKTSQMQVRLTIVDVCLSESSASQVAVKCVGGTPVQIIQEESNVTTITY
jgi:hypothetical protein